MTARTEMVGGARAALQKGRLLAHNVTAATPVGRFAPARVSLSHDGRIAAAIESGRVHILEVRTGRQIEVDLDADAIAAFADQVWVVAAGELRRLSIAGAPMGEPVGLPPGGALHRAPSGVGAVWQATPPLELYDDLGRLVTRPLDAVAAFPMQPRCSLLVRDGAIVTGNGVLTFADRPEIRWGAPLFGGAAIVVVTRAAGRDELRVLSARDGRLVHRIPVPAPCSIAVASRTARMVILAEDRALVIDARLGRVDFEAALAVDAIAIDDRGTAAVVRDGRLVVGTLEHLLTESQAPARPRSAVREAPAGPSPPAPLLRVATPPLRQDPGAFGPRPSMAPARERALRCLDAERDVVAARALLGIARGWDTRRLGYPSESAHPFELEVAALIGVGRGHAAEHLASAADRLALACAARDAAWGEGTDEPPIAALARELGLGALERELVVLIAAPALWGEMARLYGVLANDAARALVDEHLLIQLLDGTVSRYDVAAALAPDATLLVHGVVVSGGQRRPFAPLAIDPVVCARLRGGATTPLPGIEVRRATVELEDIVVPRDRLARLCDDLATSREAPLRLVVRGRRGSGRRTLLAALARGAGRDLGVIDVAALGLDAAFLPARLGRLLRQAALAGLVPCLAGGDGAVADVVRAHPGPVAAIVPPDGDAPFGPGHIAIALPPLGAGERAACWERGLARHGVGVGEAELLAARYRIPPGAIETACARAAGGGLVDIDDAVRQMRDMRLGRLASPVTRTASWSDLVLPPEIVDSLRELVARVRHGRRVFEEWGFDAVVTTGRGLTALFEGRPGTGKTMVAGVIARELGLDLYRVDVSRLVSKWIGETEKHLAEIFDAVDDGKAIILFDEADSLFGKRTEVKSSNDRYANLEVNYLLQRLDTFEGIAILTTNFGSAIDSAFRRRLSCRITFPFPDEEARERLWRCHIPKAAPVHGNLELGALARRHQMSGGYIRNACVRAAFLAAQEGSPLTQQHLARACVLEYQQIGKISTTGPVE